MDRRSALRSFARIRAAIRRRLPAPLEARATDAWNRVQGRYRRRRADVVLISYPKAGRTWLCLMLGHALQRRFAITGPSTNDLESLHDADRRVPRIFSTHDGVMPGLRAGQVRTDKSRYRRQSVVLLVRDPRDVVVSDYYHLHDRTRAIATDLDSFVVGPESGVDTVIAFHAAWRDALHVPRRVLVVRYEDLHAFPERELRRVLEFLGVWLDEAAITEATRFASFESMKAIERSGRHETGALRPSDVNNPASYKVRRGAVGGYRDDLRAATCAMLDAKVARADLGCFGYSAPLAKCPP